eukprot:13010838-Alexandrium_andersonii.AAC.1
MCIRDRLLAPLLDSPRGVPSARPGRPEQGVRAHRPEVAPGGFGRPRGSPVAPLSPHGYGRRL